MSYTPKARTDYEKSDSELLARIRKIVTERPSYGYRSVTAQLNGHRPYERVNHKRVYRVMLHAGSLLRRYGKKPTLTHEGAVITLASDMRWCSDMFKIRCWNGEKVFVAFSLDCCDREAIS